MGFKYGLIIPNTKASGNATKPMAEEFFITQMGMPMMESGRMTRPVGRGPTCIAMEQST